MGTYFHYSEEELKSLSQLSSDYIITIADLEKWDDLLLNYFQVKFPSAGRIVRVFTYLYAAQRDFAFLSQQMKGEFTGSLDSISLQITRLFYPFFALPDDWNVDEYSIVLGERIFQKYKRRYEEEQESKKHVAHLFSISSWTYSIPDYGKVILGWHPWAISPLTLKTVPAPPGLQEKDFWGKQLDAVVEANKNLTEEQKNIANYWGNFFDPEGGDWISLTNNYLFSHHTSLKKSIYVRSLLTMTLYDALILTFESKYTFSIHPPFVVNKQIKPYIKRYYPAYPSLHATLSYAAAEILSHFFPEASSRWEKLAEDAANSQVWVGMNYPVDIEVGKDLGKTIANSVIENQ